MVQQDMTMEELTNDEYELLRKYRKLSAWEKSVVDEEIDKASARRSSVLRIEAVSV